jgi:hypothetical protein
VYGAVDAVVVLLFVELALQSAHGTRLLPSRVRLRYQGRGSCSC